MNKHFNFTILLVLLALFVNELNASEEYVPSVNINNTTINGIKLNSKEKEIIKILGKPQKTINNGISEVTGGDSQTLYYHGLKIYLINSEIYNLECNGKSCKTGKGIKIGDTREMIEKTYGPPSKYEITGDRIGYTFRLNKIYIDSSLVFFLKDNKVVRIIFHVDYT